MPEISAESSLHSRLPKCDVWCPQYLRTAHIKSKIHPRAGHECPVAEQRYSSTLSSTSALDVAALPSGNRPDAYCTGGCAGPRAGLDSCGKSRLHRDSISEPMDFTKWNRRSESIPLNAGCTVHFKPVQIRTRQEIYVQRNNEARSRNHCCRGHAINISCSERM